MTPTQAGADEPERLGTPNPNAPLTRPFYATLSEFERQVLDSRQGDLMREQRMEYDPYA